MMKKPKITAVILLLALSFALCGCAEKGAFTLSYANGMDIESSYDTGLLYKNNTQLWGGDSGVIWVSKEQDPVYGGYFYQYMSEAGGVANTCPSTEDGQTPPVRNNNVGELAYWSHVALTRSKDLNDWELCPGAIDNGMALQVMEDEWVSAAVWAPEVVYHAETDKYYMFFSAWSWVNNEERREKGATYSDSTTNFDRFYIGIAASDTPVGPFRLIRSIKDDPAGNFDPETSEFIRDENGKIKQAINPTIMMDAACDELFYTDEFRNSANFASKDEDFAAIDLNPFFDDNGDFYLYFVKHASSKNSEGNTIWVVKMKDMVTPDYSTISLCIANSFWRSDIVNAHGTSNKSFVRVKYKGIEHNDPAYPRHLASSYDRYTTYEDGHEQGDDNIYDGAICEAPQMLISKDKEGKKVYILAYSPRGVGPTDYDVKFAYSYNPFDGFVKPEESQGATILGVDANNRFMSSLGHVQFLDVDGEDWIVHWEWPAPFAGSDMGRVYALSSMTWQYEPSLGFDIPVANGPTSSLQPLPAVASGYRNIASKAAVTATNEIDGSAKYLTDGMAVTMARNANKEFRAKGNKTTIRMKFDKAYDVRGLLIYNSYNYAYSFKKVSKIRFGLAKTPEWHNGSETSCVIKDLPYNVEAYTMDKNILQAGSAAVATFDELCVTEIEIEFTENDKLGTGEELRISDIVVLGR